MATRRRQRKQKATRKSRRGGGIYKLLISDNICYDGKGSNPSHNHTSKEFVGIMDKYYKDQCAADRKKQSCEACKQYKKLYDEYLNKYLEYQRRGKEYKMPKLLQQTLGAKSRKCERCSKKNTTRCNLKEYVEFSGAQVGKCKTSVSKSNSNTKFKLFG